MKQLSEILNYVLASGIVIQMLFYRSKRRKEKAEADVSEFDAMQMQVKHFSEQLKEAYVENDKMQGIIDSQRTRLVELTKELSNIQIELVKTQSRASIAEFNRCDADCVNRIPPRNIENNEQRIKE